MTRLSNAGLQGYDGPASLPEYDRASVTAGILHLGIGAFHRAHQAVYMDDLLTGDPSWGIIAASLRRPDTRLALEPQDGLYTLAVLDGKTVETRVIGSVLRVLDWTLHAEDILAAIADPSIRIISVTVTEKGYCRTPSGDLDVTLPVVAGDLAGQGPHSLPGILVTGLARRMLSNGGPVTVLSCDNLPDNGPATARVIRQFAQHSAPDLVAWIDANVTFPSSMVDRITPATTQADIDAINATTGLIDAWPISTEPFSQWVIEDRFAAGRPEFEVAGVQMVADVAPFEAMKLRMLNGAHSTLAYAGGLMGYDYVSEAVGDADMRARVTAIIRDEVIPTLALPSGDLEVYWQALLARFANTSLHHRLDQIAQDGSQKLPQRLLATCRDALEAGRSVSGLTFAVAAWIVWVERRKSSGLPLIDPLAEQLYALIDRAGADVGLFLDQCGVFGDLATHPSFRQQVTDHVIQLRDQRKTDGSQSETAGT